VVQPPVIYFDPHRLLDFPDAKQWPLLGVVIAHEFGHAYEAVVLFKSVAELQAEESHNHKGYWKDLKLEAERKFGIRGEEKALHMDFVESALEQEQERFRRSKEQAEESWRRDYDVANQ
jgi:hypothetical protein